MRGHKHTPPRVDFVDWAALHPFHTAMVWECDLCRKEIADAVIRDALGGLT